MNVAVQLIAPDLGAEASPDLGASVRARRRALGLRQVDLAQACAVSLSMLCALEQGAGQPTSRSHVLDRILISLSLLEEADRGR
jgi:predicted transcriptional regulator